MKALVLLGHILISSFHKTTNDDVIHHYDTAAKLVDDETVTANRVAINLKENSPLSPDLGTFRLVDAKIFDRGHTMTIDEPHVSVQPAESHVVQQTIGLQGKLA